MEEAASSSEVPDRDRAFEGKPMLDGWLAGLLSNMSILPSNWQLNRFSPSQSLLHCCSFYSLKPESCSLQAKLVVGAAESIALKWARVDCSFVNVSTNVQRKSHRNRQKEAMRMRAANCKLPTVS